MPEKSKGIEALPKRVKVMPLDLDAVKRHIAETVGGQS